MRREKFSRLTILFFIFLLPIFLFSQRQPLLKISVKDLPGFSRVIIESPSPLSANIEKAGSFLAVKMRADVAFRIQRKPFRSKFIKSLGWSKGQDFYMLTVQTESPDFWYDSFRIPNPPQLIIDISSEKKTEKEQPLAEKKKIPSNTEKQGLSYNQENQSSNNSGPFGMKTVVIDPGHGGLESGAKGKFGALEKDITLDIALKLKEIIKKNMAYRVVLTREKDTYVSLESRASVANNNRAYLFISIHANSSYRKKASGSETFFLSLNATDEEARRLAYLENNSSELDGRIASDNGDDIKMILWDLAQSSYLKQSSQLAECIQRELNALLHTANRGIKQAPFKVLTGVACPAVLVEVAFLSNPDEEKKLLTEGFQKNVARAIYRGLMNFLKFYSKE